MQLYANPRPVTLQEKMLFKVPQEELKTNFNFNGSTNTHLSLKVVSFCSSKPALFSQIV